MSVLVSALSNTVYVVSDESETHRDCVRDPRPLSVSLPVYLISRKNFLVDEETILRHNKQSVEFTNNHDSHCCLNCQRFLVKDLTTCKRCYQFYCLECSDLVKIDDKCPWCRRY